MSFVITRQKKKDTRTEVFADLDMKLPNQESTYKLEAKVDTEAEGNTFPKRVFRKMFPNKVSSSGQPLPGLTDKSTVLTTYNDSSVPQHGPINIQCTYKWEW